MLILPFPATTYDDVYTTMVNFQDILKQKQRLYGPLLCDEGVYYNAKSFNSLIPENFITCFSVLEGST